MSASGLLGLLSLALLSYLAGSFPTSIIVGRLFFGLDIRTKGSGNAGGTNSFRVLGWRAGLLVVIVDVGKGAIAALFIARLGQASGLPPEILGLLAGALAVVGHVWTVFAGFRGGKGVATAAGALVVLAPLPIGIAALVFALVLFSTGIVSVASLSAALSFPLSLLGLGLLGLPPSPWLLGFALLLAPLIFITHRANIGRLLRGEEYRFEHLVLWKRFTKGSRN
ncbi:MAG TPA: glycerol-3-phosphate 1-O-acyltransferase PlsY [Rectinemataceae bacterium]|nr:glycerol-3-phosphate 1-O-acyltransferase PlsY [Rectinemataceae bacterium]